MMLAPPVTGEHRSRAGYHREDAGSRHRHGGCTRLECLPRLLPRTSRLPRAARLVLPVWRQPDAARPLSRAPVRWLFLCAWCLPDVYRPFASAWRPPRVHPLPPVCLMPAALCWAFALRYAPGTVAGRSTANPPARNAPRWEFRVLYSRKFRTARPRNLGWRTRPGCYQTPPPAFSPAGSAVPATAPGRRPAASDRWSRVRRSHRPDAQWDIWLNQ